MRLTYPKFMEILRTAWNYTYRNTSNNVVEPYPEDLPPSQITKDLNLTKLVPNLSTILKHADHIFSNKHLKNYIPYKAEISYNNPSPYIIDFYAQNHRAARHRALELFSEYLKSKNHPMYKHSVLTHAINNGQVVIKITEV